MTPSQRQRLDEMRDGAKACRSAVEMVCLAMASYDIPDKMAVIRDVTEKINSMMEAEYGREGWAQRQMLIAALIVGKVGVELDSFCNDVEDGKIDLSTASATAAAANAVARNTGEANLN